MNKKNKEYVLPNLIIGGTPKSGTSSIFTYLRAHPSVCGSKIKETAFFQKEYLGRINEDIINYSKYFIDYNSKSQVVMEASPGYLVIGKEIASRIKEMIPDVKLLFILRNPVDRFYSYYNFHINQMTNDFDISLTIEDYMNLCFEYYDKADTQESFKMDIRHLQALKTGSYKTSLDVYYHVFDSQQIKIMFYDDLKSNIRTFLFELCEFLNIDKEFYKSYDLTKKVNVTMSPRLKSIHKIALKLNTAMEPLLRQRPEIKNGILQFYKYLNQQKEGYSPMPEDIKKQLLDFYNKENQGLIDIINAKHYPSWVQSK